MQSWYLYSQLLFMLSCCILQAAAESTKCSGGRCTHFFAGSRPMPPFVEFQYSPSPLETAWTKNVKEWSSKEQYCKSVEGFKAEGTEWIEKNTEMMSTDQLSGPEQNSSKVFSSFIKSYQCHGHSYQLVSWIEPLAFSLRYPFAPCPEPQKLQDRNYLTLMSAAELEKLSCGLGKVRTFYFDLGASTWSSGAGGASQQWFVEAYARRGIKFDRMLMWEATPHTSKEIFTEVPSDVLKGYQYMNIPATTGKDDPTNPLNILREITTPDDFVAFKIDIDMNPVEMLLMEQLLNDRELYSRVDEFFFEHHVNFDMMMAYGWSRHTSSNNTYLEDSYKLFLSLRKKGIRAHGWP